MEQSQPICSGDQGSNAIAPAGRPTLILCAGTQSSGSTLLSWCFLQRQDTDGVLDARFDALPAVPPVATPVAWVKMTIACFTLAEAVDHFHAEGYTVRPVLLVRDVRAVFDSLITKEYGRNSTTAEDPPIRVRLRRFLADWREARARGWPVVRYESLCAQPQRVLTQACDALGLPWDPDMMSWPKSIRQIADARYGNDTLLRTLARDLPSTVRPVPPLDLSNVPVQDLAWLDETFADFNEAMGYPAAVWPATRCPVPRAVPEYALSRRFARERRKRRRLSWWWRRALQGRGATAPA